MLPLSFASNGAEMGAFSPNPSEEEVITLNKGNDMQNDKGIMGFEPVLPSDFDGVFRFSNPFKEDFIGTWAKRQYLFPAGVMTPMIIPEHSPLEIQHIRKKFAKDLAEREWYKSKGYKVLRDQEGKTGERHFNSIHQAAAYTITDLEPYIQMCLKPLELGQILSKKVEETPMEDKLTRNDRGELNTDVVQLGKDSLRAKALNAQ